MKENRSFIPIVAAVVLLLFPGQSVGSYLALVVSGGAISPDAIIIPPQGILV